MYTYYSKNIFLLMKHFCKENSLFRQAKKYLFDARDQDLINFKINGNFDEIKSFSHPKEVLLNH